MNRTVKLLILSDIFIATGFGLITPILAIFIKEDIAGGTIFTAGLASTLYLITKSLIQLPFSRHVDTSDNKKKLLIIGTALIVIVPFFYLLASDIRHVYVIQIVYGIGSGMAYPARLGIWSLVLDKKHESFERSVYSTAIGIGTAITAAVGGALAQYVGFTALFAAVGIFAIIGALVLLKLQNKKINNQLMEQI